MKRILCLALALVFCFSLTACSKKEEKKVSKIGIDVEYYAKAGLIPECEFHLGQSVDEVLNILEERQKTYEEENEDAGHTHDSDQDANFFYHSEDAGIIMTYGDKGCMYRYDVENKLNGITHIICSNEAYEFKISDVSKEIKDALASYGFKSDERKLTDKEIRLYGAIDGATALEYNFEKNTVLFIFNDNALFTTVLHS